MVSKVLLVVQPSLSHYREPFVRALLESKEYSFEIAGRFSKKNREITTSNSVNSASTDLLSNSHRLTRKKVLSNFVWDGGLLKLVLRNKYELVILEGNFYNLTTWIVAILMRIMGRKVSFWGHGWKRPDSGFKKKLRKNFYRLPHGHFVYGNRAKEIANNEGLDVKKWHVIYNSLYSSDLLGNNAQKTSKGNESLSLIFCGRLTPRHRVDLLVKAINQLGEQGELNIQLDIVGDGTELKKLKNLASEGSQVVRFHGPEHNAEILAQLYSASDFAVSPGASGLNVIQALGFGVPVIAASLDPQSGPEIEAIRDGDTGILFDYGNVDSLKGALKSAGQMDVSDLNTMSQAGVSLVQEYYVAEKQSGFMLRGIGEILSK